MFVLMTDLHYHLEHFDTFSSDNSSMSNQIHKAATESESNPNSVTSSSTMPVLLHSKRKRLDAVLTKLSLSTCKDEHDPKKTSHLLHENTNVSSNKLSSDEAADLVFSLTNNSIEQEKYRSPFVENEIYDKSPQKQRSLDSEMSITVGNLKLDIREQSEHHLWSINEQRSAAENLKFNSFSSAVSEPKVCCQNSQQTHSEATTECKLFSNSSSDIVATSTSVFTPPTIDAAGGTTHLDENEQENAKNGNHENEVTDTTTVMRHTSDNLFGSHQQAEQQLLQSLPQAKLLSHDSHRHKCTSENALIPDPRTRSPLPPHTTRPTKLVPSSSPPFCASLLFSRLPYLGLSADTLPSFPICKCSHCSNLAGQTSGKMPPVSGVDSIHSQAWSWHNLKHDSPLFIDPFSYLVSSSNAKLDRDNLSPPGHPVELTAPNEQWNNLFSSSSSPSTESPHSTKPICSSKLTTKHNKRSRSDSDMMPEYLSLFKSLGTRIDNPVEYLHSLESGVMLKNGRRVPKPLSRAALQLASEQNSPQESPLDLSVKPLSAHILVSGRSASNYSNILALNEQAVNSVCSAPSFDTMISKPYRFSIPHAMSPLTMHLKSNTNQHKRRNISSSDSLNSSSLSSISSLSPPYKPSTESKEHKEQSPGFEFYQDEKTKPTKLEPISSVDHDPSKVSSSKPKGHRQANKNKMISNYSSEEKALSLSSLSDLDGVSSSHACSICGQTFSFYDRLAKHMASRHRNRQQCDSAAKNYVCESCHRSFARSDMLTRHMRLHTGVKPYMCGTCNQVFSRSDHLSTHQRTHTGEKPYKCPQCPYAACRRDMITRHMKTHSRYEVPDSSSSFEDLSKSA